MSEAAQRLKLWSTHPAAGIEAERMAILDRIAREVSALITHKGSAALNFICTHNSRRSHLAEIWCRTALAYHKVSGISTYSGGSEATALYTASAKAMEALGFDVHCSGGQNNPEYKIFLPGLESAEDTPVLFSKTYDHQSNPRENFVAVLVCDHAFESCPMVHGCSAKIGLMYIDPKWSDGNDEQHNVYVETAKTIGREMNYLAIAIAKG